MRARLSASLLLLAAACGVDEGKHAEDDSPRGATSDEQPSAQPEPLAALEVRGHSIYFYEETDGRLTIAEKGKVGEASLLDDVRPGSTPSEMFAQLGAEPVPESLLAYERRQGIVASSAGDARAAAEPAAESAEGVEGFDVLKHEDGPQHFTEAHCPQAAFDNAFSGYRTQFERDTARLAANIIVRQFCWSAGHTGSHTESATAAVMSHSVSAVWGDICFSRADDQGSKTWTILQGEQWNFGTYNRPALWDPCNKGEACSWGYGSAVAPMRASVGCADGDEWRWGGIFLKHRYTRFDRWY